MGASGRTSRDVTGYDVAPEALLRAVIEMSDDAIFTCDTGGKVATWSDSAERLVGSPEADIIGSPLQVLLPEHLQEELKAISATVLAGDRIKHFETEILRPDGTPVLVSLSMCPIFGAGESPVGAVVIVRDVTEQRLAQATLARAEARLEEGEAMAHIGSWLWDLRTGAVQWSAEFHRIHGVDPLDFDGTFESHLGSIHPSDREAVKAAMELSVASGRPFEDRYRVVRPDQEVRVLSVWAHPTVGSAGTAVGLGGLGRDVTEEQKAARITGGPRAS